VCKAQEYYINGQAHVVFTILTDITEEELL